MKDSPAGEPTLDVAKVGISKILAYLLGWSFVGRDGRPESYNLEQPEDIRRALIDNLDQDTYRELLTAITTHEDREEQALVAKKNAPATVSSSSPT